MDYKVRKHNKPISIAIKGFLDKKGGKVIASRREIEWRFDALDWRYQKQILFAFLQSGKMDREWAYKKLFVFWDDCFIPTIKELWESHHEIEATRLVIRYFPIDYIKNNMDCLSEGRNYFFLYRRLSDDKDFALDKTRLFEYDFLYVWRESGEIITPDDVRDLFFLLIYKLCKRIYHFKAWKVTDLIDNEPTLTIFCNSKVRRMMSEIYERQIMLRLGEELSKWMSSVTKSFLEENDFPNVYNNYEEEERVHHAMAEHCLKSIASEYTTVWDTYGLDDKQRFIDYLEERHHERMSKMALEKKETQGSKESPDFFQYDVPPLSRLMEMFDLEIERE